MTVGGLAVLLVEVRNDGTVAWPFGDRLPQIRLCGAEPEWHDSLILRGVKSLPVALT